MSTEPHSRGVRALHSSVGAAAMLLASIALTACGDSSPDALAAPGTAPTAPVTASTAMEPISAPPSGQARIIEEKQISARLLELTIATTAFAEPTKVHVNLPAGYSTGKRWPVTLYLAGTNHTYADFNQQYGGGELTKDFASLVVSPTGKAGYWSDWYQRGAFGPPMYESYVIDQLIPLIDARFSTIGKRAGRAVMGESMGGYGAFMLAAQHPDLFAAAASVSGTVNTNLTANAAALTASSAIDGAEPDAIYGPRATEEVRWRGHNPFDLAENLRTLTLWMGSANGTMIDPAMGEMPADVSGCALELAVHDASLSLHERLGALGIAHVWKDFGAGCHSVPNFQRQIKEALQVFTAVFDRQPALPASVDHLAVEPVVEVWNWSLAADAGRASEFLRMDDAGATGLKLSGSGLTTVTTPPFYAAVRQVRVEGGLPATAIPDPSGRIRFTVDLGAANPQQQYSPLANTAVKTVDVRLLPNG